VSVGDRRPVIPLIGRAVLVLRVIRHADRLARGYR
jgi:hypothetical protein